jgi:hypothetical protein
MKIKCGNCNHSFDVPDGYPVGEKLKCPGCGKLLNAEPLKKAEPPKTIDPPKPEPQIRHSNIFLKAVFVLAMFIIFLWVGMHYTFYRGRQAGFRDTVNSLSKIDAMMNSFTPLQKLQAAAVDAQSASSPDFYQKYGRFSGQVIACIEAGYTPQQVLSAADAVEGDFSEREKRREFIRRVIRSWQKEQSPQQPSPELPSAPAAAPEPENRSITYQGNIRLRARLGDFICRNITFAETAGGIHVSGSIENYARRDYRWVKFEFSCINGRGESFGTIDFFIWDFLYEQARAFDEPLAAVSLDDIDDVRIKIASFKTTGMIPPTVRTEENSGQ